MKRLFLLLLILAPMFTQAQLSPAFEALGNQNIFGGLWVMDTTYLAGMIDSTKAGDTILLRYDPLTGRIDTFSSSRLPSGGAAASYWSQSATKLYQTDTTKILDVNFFTSDVGTRHLINDSVLSLPFTGAYKTDGTGYLLSGIIPYPTISNAVAGYYKSSADQQLYYADSTRLNIYSFSPIDADTAFAGIHALRGDAPNGFETDLHLDTKYGLQLSFKKFKTKVVSNRQIHIDSTGVYIQIRKCGGSLENAFQIDSNKNITFNNAYTFPLADGNANEVLTTDGSGVVTWQPAAGGDTKFWQKNSKVLSPVAITDTVMVGATANVGTELFGVTNGAVMFSGTTGATPTSGAGTRLMWIPAKGAFRAGVVTGTRWDNANIGTSSIAMGYNPSATNSYAISMGYETQATGVYAIAMGNSCQVSGNNSVGMGNGAIVTGNSSFGGGYLPTVSGTSSAAFGDNPTASGEQSFCVNYVNVASGNNTASFGDHTTADAFDMATFGRYNVTGGMTSNSWVSTDRLFVVGNGTGTGASSNDAFKVLKNGDTYIADGSSSTDPIMTVKATDSTVAIIADIIQTGSFNYGIDTAGDDDYEVAQPDILAYVTGQIIIFKAETANTGACTLKVNGLAVINLKSNHDLDPPNDYIEAGSMVMVIYDGTNFQIQTPDANP